MRLSLKKCEQAQCQCYGTGEEPDSIAANITTLPWADGFTCLLCTPSHEVEGTIDNATVEPCDWLREQIEDNLVGEELPSIVDIETVQGCLVQLRHLLSQSVCQWSLLRSIHVSSQTNTDDCNNHRCSCHAHVDMDIVALTCSRYEVTEWNQTTEARDEHLQDLHIEDNKGRRFAVSPYLKDNHYAALVAWNAKEQDFRAFVIAKDKAGNVTKERIRYYLINRKYRNSNIALKDGFLDGKIEDLAQQYAQNKNLARLEKFKFVNETLRLGNEERIHKVSAQAKKDYNGLQFTRFVPLKNAMKVGDFADHRFYSYNGEFVSESYHLGIDLASVARDNIYASLDGKVIFAEENGIYGINIIIDHGFGLYSLYGHCSSKLVAEGDEIKAGEIIAKTGTSGLALGDHLHFGILVQGVEVRPEQFQDAKWLQSYIISVLEEGRKIILKERK